MNHQLKKVTNKYVFMSLCLLVVFNLCIGVYHEYIASTYAGKFSELSALRLKQNYEDYYNLSEFYNSNSSRYSELCVSEWYNVISDFYDDIEVSDEDVFYAYLDEIHDSSCMEIGIYNGETFEQKYPVARRGIKATRIADLSIDAINTTLEKEGNLLHEVYKDEVVSISKIVRTGNGDILSLTLEEVFSPYSISVDDETAVIKTSMDYHVDTEEVLSAYYIVDDGGNLVLSSQDQEIGQKLEVLNSHREPVDFSQRFYGHNKYSEDFTVGDTTYKKHQLFVFPLEDGNQMLVMTNKLGHRMYINESRFMTLLITMMGVIALYVMGHIMLYIIEHNPLTSRRISMSNKSIRMAILMLSILVLLNGLAVIQVTRSIFFNGFEDGYVTLLKGYAREMEHEEAEYKNFVEKVVECSRLRARFIHRGMELFYDLSPKTRTQVASPLYTYEYSQSLPKLQGDKSELIKTLETKGHLEVFLGPKLFSINSFDAFYENYVLEPLPGETWHTIYRVDIFKDTKNEGYYLLKHDFRKKMRLFDDLRYEYDALRENHDKEPFLSFVSIYNDNGEKVIHSRDGSGNTRTGKDFLTNYPLWHLYQFTHETMFRTLEETIEGAYDEFYNVVFYDEVLEYYFVYKLPKKMIIKELESLYNLYVFAIIVLLISVFITLGIKVKINKRSE
jgi:hypothetical protein